MMFCMLFWILTLHGVMEWGAFCSFVLMERPDRRRLARAKNHVLSAARAAVRSERKKEKT
jgi:hypothetical protein